MVRSQSACIPRSNSARFPALYSLRTRPGLIRRSSEIGPPRIVRRSAPSHVHILPVSRPSDSVHLSESAAALRIPAASGLYRPKPARRVSARLRQGLRHNRQSRCLRIIGLLTKKTIKAAPQVSHAEASLHCSGLWETALRADREPSSFQCEETAIAPAIGTNSLSGVRNGVNGTPTFFIDGARYDGPVDPSSLVVAMRFLRWSTAAPSGGIEEEPPC